MKEDYIGLVADEDFVPKSIVFRFGNENELMKLCENGDIFIRGELVENNKKVLEELKKFLNIK